MKTVVVYVSNHGAAGSVARKLGQLMQLSDSDVVDLRSDKNFNPEGYERIVIGGSIHAGRIQRRVKDFCNKYAPVLVQRKLGLYVCCMYTGEQALQQFELNFPEALRNHSSSNKIMGGTFNFEKMNWFEKMIVKKVAGVDKTTSNLDESKIAEMAEEMS